MNKIACICTLSLLLVSCNSLSTQRGVDDARHTLPRNATLSVPFTVQAPFADWETPYQEACEEAALLMVHAYRAGEERLTKQQANEQLLALIGWEEQRGYTQDVTLKELAGIAEAYYGYRAEIMENPSVQDIEQQIVQGNPVIIPAAGRMLGNPYFSGEGPWYHMLVITGYTPRRFITNDPGTKRGRGFRYKRDVLMEALHDWTGVKEEIQKGRKVALILLPGTGEETGEDSGQQ